MESFHEYNQEELQVLSIAERNKIIALWSIDYWMTMITGYFAIQQQKIPVEDSLLAAVSFVTATALLCKKMAIRMKTRNKFWNLLCQNPDEYQQLIEEAEKSENRNIVSGAKELDLRLQKRVQRQVQKDQPHDMNTL